MDPETELQALQAIEKQLPAHLPPKFLGEVYKAVSIVDIARNRSVSNWVTLQANPGSEEIGLLLDLQRSSPPGLDQDRRIDVRNAIALDSTTANYPDYVFGLSGFLQMLGNVVISENVSGEAGRQLAHWSYIDKSGMQRPSNTDATFIGKMKDTVAAEAKGIAASLLAQYLRLEHPTDAFKAPRGEIISNALAAIAGEKADAWVHGDMNDFPPGEQWIRHQFMQQLTVAPVERDLDDLFVEKVPNPKAVQGELSGIAKSVPALVLARRVVLESRPLQGQV